MITNYGTLKTAVADWLKRKNLDSQVPEFIQLAEIKLRDGITVPDARGGTQTLAVRVREMWAKKTYNPGDSDTNSATVNDPVSSFTLPADYLEARWLQYFLTRSYMLERVSSFTNAEAASVAGRPRFYATEESDEVFVSPTTDTLGGFVLGYYQDFTGNLSSDTDTNVILTNYPNLYLYASLVSAEPYLYNDPRVATWLSELVSGIRSANAREMLESRSGSRQRVGGTF